MDIKNRMIRIIAVTDLMLILPASLFLLAVTARHIGPLAYPAQQIVIWYATRFWTLWVLMITLPLTALLIGCVTLLMNGRAKERQTIRQRLAAIRKSVPLLIIAVSIFAAGAILAIVALHMLLN